MEHLKGTLHGKAPTLLANNSLGLNGLPGTNKVTYYKQFYFTDSKSFITLSLARLGTSSKAQADRGLIYEPNHCGGTWLCKQEKEAVRAKKIYKLSAFMLAKLFNISEVG